MATCKRKKRSHRPHIDYHNYDTYRHPVSVIPGTPLARWYRRKTLRVNSYHHQGIRELARRFRPMAHADDGLIEAYYDPQAAFVVGLQFHPERMLKEYAGNLRVWQAFAAAVHRTHRSRLKVEAKPGHRLHLSKPSISRESTAAHA